MTSPGTEATPRTHIERVHPRLDPLKPAGDPSEPTVKRVDRPHSPLEELVRDLGRPFGLRKELVCGPPGSGKSTELLALVARVQHRHLVLMLDLRAHFEHQRGDAAALNRLQTWEVLSVIGLALYRYGEELGLAWETEHTEALAAGLKGPAKVDITLDVGGLAKEIALLVSALAIGPAAEAGLKTVAAVAGNISAKLPLGLDDPTRRLPDQDEQVQHLRAAVTLLGQALQDHFHRKLLVVVDGIDRGDTDLARRLFEESRLLATLPWHQIYCAPQSLRKRNVSGFDARPICSLPVRKKEDPWAYGGGIAFFRALWRSRAESAGVPLGLLPTDCLDRLAWASGGFVRQFLEMAIDALELAWDDDTCVTTDHVNAVEDRWRRRWEEDLGSTRKAALKDVLEHRVHDDSSLQLELIDQRCIVAYPNDSIWYSPHPLLLIHFVATRPVPE